MVNIKIFIAPNRLLKYPTGKDIKIPDKEKIELKNPIWVKFRPKSLAMNGKRRIMLAKKPSLKKCKAKIWVSLFFKSE